MDIQMVMKNLTDAKELIQSVMEELKRRTLRQVRLGREYLPDSTSSARRP